MSGERHPRGLYVLFFTEMWERFSFYLMLGILPLYLSDSQKGGMGWTDEQTAVVVGSYIGLVYFTPFIGGLPPPPPPPRPTTPPHRPPPPYIRPPLPPRPAQ